MVKTGLDSNLDILRSVAVLTVLLTHLLQVTAGCKFDEHIAYGIETYSLGAVGVLLFFVHTSLVLMQSLERSSGARTGWRLVRFFYIRRAFRLYPLSISVILLSIALSIPPNALGTPYRWGGVRWLFSNLLLVQNISGSGLVAHPLWSLPFEVQMYLVLPALFLLVSPPKSGIRLTVIYIAGVALSPLHFLFRYVPCFLAGVVAYKLARHVRPRVPAWLWGPTVVAAVAYYTWAPYSTRRPKDVMICVIVGILIPFFRANSGPIAAAAAQVAKYSYGIYLCHTPVLWLLYRKLSIPGWQRPIWLLIGTGAAAVACYRWIERPMIELGTRLANRDLAGPPAAEPNCPAVRSIPFAPAPSFPDASPGS
jgi:peptidoglycan/LPS O-acetylase OafA/YrhL